MHFYKHKMGNCGLLFEANRDLYRDNETGEYIRDSSTSLIDFDRTPYNYNLSKNDMSIEDIYSLNCKYRHVQKLSQKQNAFCQIRGTLPQNFDIPGHPDFKYLVGKNRIYYLLEHPDAKQYVDKFFEEMLHSLQRQFNIRDEDICSAWVHYDESNPHMHFYFIPVIHEGEKPIELTDHQREQLQRYQEYDKLTENPKAFYEQIKSDYEAKLTKYPKDSKEYKKAEKDLKTLLTKGETSKGIEKYARDRHRDYKRKIKELTATTVSETVSVNKKFNRKNMYDMFDKVSDDVSAALGFRVEMRTGESLWFDTQKATKEQKQKAMEAKAETLAAQKERDYAQKQADAEVERLYTVSTERAEAQKDLAKLNSDINTQALENACLKAEKHSLQAEKNNIQSETQKLQDIQNNIRANLTAFTNDYYTSEYQKAANRGDRQTASDIMNTVFQRSALCDQYKSENKQLSHMNSVLTTECNQNKIFKDAIQNAPTYEDIMQMFDDKTLTNRDISEAIKLYSLVQNDDSTNSIIKTCNALEKIDAYTWKSYCQRNRPFINKTNGMEMVENHNFKYYEKYDKQIREMLKKSLDFNGRKEIYQQNMLKNLWADIQADNRLFWDERKTKKKKPIPDEVESLDKAFTAIIPGLIQAAIQAIRTCLDMIRQVQQEEQER